MCQHCPLCPPPKKQTNKNKTKTNKQQTNKKKKGQYTNKWAFDTAVQGICWLVNQEKMEMDEM